MENPLGLIRSQIYRLFITKSKEKIKTPDNDPSPEHLKLLFPWANEREIELIRKEKLYLDSEFNGGTGTAS